MMTSINNYTTCKVSSQRQRGGGAGVGYRSAVLLEVDDVI